MSWAPSSAWNSGSVKSCVRGSARKPLEIVGLVFLFFYFWPLAMAYIAWKLMGYPVPAEIRGVIDRGFGGLRNDFRWSPAAFGGTGNLAFDAYRRSEIERLETERRRLDEEAREFRTFVEDVKRAKDREEFDAYMRKRREAGGTSV